MVVHWTKNSSPPKSLDYLELSLERNTTTKHVICTALTTYFFTDKYVEKVIRTLVFEKIANFSPKMDINGKNSDYDIKPRSASESGPSGVRRHRDFRIKSESENLGSILQNSHFGLNFWRIFFLNPPKNNKYKFICVHIMNNNVGFWVVLKP
jgi:hypothetical protein